MNSPLLLLLLSFARLCHSSSLSLSHTREVGECCQGGKVEDRNLWAEEQDFLWGQLTPSGFGPGNDPTQPPRPLRHGTRRRPQESRQGALNEWRCGPIRSPQLVMFGISSCRARSPLRAILFLNDASLCLARGS